MLDRPLRPLLDMPLNAGARLLLRTKLSANALTLLGAVLAPLLALTIADGRFGLALLLLAINRILDGLDGALARLRGSTAFGGYLDSVCDYLFYAAVPLAFAWLDPAANALAAAAVLASFLLTASSFLAYAAVAATRNAAPTPTAGKSFVYSRGLIEGTETIAFFVAMLLWPAQFVLLAWTLAALCVLTTVLRVRDSARRLA